jgi:hypothetical protein
MKTELQEILNKISEYSQYKSEQFNDYRNLVRLCIEKLQTLSAEDPSPVLATWVDMGMEELKKELNVRLTDNFASLSVEKQRTEFMYSRSTVTLTLTNIIMNL